METIHTERRVMVKFINYKELSVNKDYPYMRDNLAKEPYLNKEIIIDFLMNKGDILLAQLSRSKDVFSGERIPFELLVRRDGEYQWANILSWYVEKYNLRMPEEFEQYILEKMKE